MFVKEIQVVTCVFINTFGFVIGNDAIKIKRDPKITIIVCGQLGTFENIASRKAILHGIFYFLLVRTQIQHGTDGLHVWVWERTRQKEGARHRKFIMFYGIQYSQSCVGMISGEDNYFHGLFVGMHTVQVEHSLYERKCSSGSRDILTIMPLIFSKRVNTLLLIQMMLGGKIKKRCRRHCDNEFVVDGIRHGLFQRIAKTSRLGAAV